MTASGGGRTRARADTEQYPAHISLAITIRKVLVVWTFVALALAASAQTTATVRASVVAVSDREYAVYDYADPATKKFCVVIPQGLKTVRGLLVECNYAGGDSRGDWTFCAYYREFLHLHGFAFVGSQGDIPHNKAFQAFRSCVQMVGVASRHPELVNAPYAATGFSAGGGFASTLMTREPEKTIAVGIVCARYNFDIFDSSKPTKPGDPPHKPPSGSFRDALLSIPSVLLTGEFENSGTVVDEVFVPYRPKGGQLGWIGVQGRGHEYSENRQDLLTMPLLDVAVRTRYPKDGDVTQGPIKLKKIDVGSGWVADNTSWKSSLTTIVPARQFKGDLHHSSWLPTEDIAFIYRAYATYDNPLAITSPDPCGPGTPALEEGANLPITVDVSKFPNWTKLEFYDGATRLGETTRGAPKFTAKNLAPGYHVFSVLGTDAAGTVRTSDPRMVVVRTPPTAIPPVGSKEARQIKAGTAKEVDAEHKQLTVLVTREMLFNVADSTKITQDGKPRKLGDIKAGDTVSVEYVRDGDTRMATRIVMRMTPVPLTAEPVERMAPNSSFAVTFPDMPLTFHAIFARQDEKAKMTIYLPRNYDPAKRHPLLVYFNGGDGGDGNTLGVPRGITGQQDFVCVSMPLFRAPGFHVDKPNSPGSDFIITEPDGRAMWPLLQTMLEKVEALVPNIDKSHRILGGFSNGAHAIAALIDGSDGEICRLFCAFLMVEGGGKLEHFDYLKDKPYLMVSSQPGSRPRALQIVEEAKAAGARTTFLFEDVGTHAFPESAYPAVKRWLCGPALE